MSATNDEGASVLRVDGVDGGELMLDGLPDQRYLLLYVCSTCECQDVTLDVNKARLLAATLIAWAEKAEQG